MPFVPMIHPLHSSSVLSLHAPSIASGALLRQALISGVVNDLFSNVSRPINIPLLHFITNGTTQSALWPEQYWGLTSWSRHSKPTHACRRALGNSSQLVSSSEPGIILEIMHWVCVSWSIFSMYVTHAILSPTSLSAQRGMSPHRDLDRDSQGIFWSMQVLQASSRCKQAIIWSLFEALPWHCCAFLPQASAKQSHD